jgi:putative polyhydroxyalkanoate system protein
MATIHIGRDRALGLTTARSDVEQIADSIQHDIKSDHERHGDELRLRRPGASVTIKVGEEFVDLEVRLGLLPAPVGPRPVG